MAFQVFCADRLPFEDTTVTVDQMAWFKGREEERPSEGPPSNQQPCPHLRRHTLCNAPFRKGSFMSVKFVSWALLRVAPWFSTSACIGKIGKSSRSMSAMNVGRLLLAGPAWSFTSAPTHASVSAAQH